MEGLLTGSRTAFDCNIDLTLYGSADSDIRAALKRSLHEARIIFKRDPAIVAAQLQHKAEESARKERERAKKQEERTARALAKRNKLAGGSSILGNSSANASSSQGELP